MFAYMFAFTERMLINDVNTSVYWIKILKDNILKYFRLFSSFDISVKYYHAN